MVEVTEVCPEGSTGRTSWEEALYRAVLLKLSAVTETLTQCVETLTRSICATETTNRPCYPCIMGTPPPSDTATVTVVGSSKGPFSTTPQTNKLVPDLLRNRNRRDNDRDGPALQHLHDHHLRRPHSGLHPRRALPRMHPVPHRNIVVMLGRGRLGHARCYDDDDINLY